MAEEMETTKEDIEKALELLELDKAVLKADYKRKVREVEQGIESLKKVLE